MKKRILFIIIFIALGAFVAWLIWGRGTPIVFSVSVYVGKQPLQGAVVEIKGKKKMVDPDGTILFTDVHVHEKEQIIITATKDEAVKRETVTITSSSLSTELVNISIVFPANFQSNKTKPIDFVFKVMDGTKPIKSELILHNEHFVSDDEGIIIFKDSIKENKLPIYIQKIGSSKEIKDTIFISDEERFAGKVERIFNFTGKVGSHSVVPLAITVRTDPIGATVSSGSTSAISGTNGSAVLDINTSVGSKVTVTIKKNKFQPKTTSFVVSEFDISDGNKTLADVELVPITEPGFADIITSPPGATIMIKGKTLPQKSPAKRVSIPSVGAEFTLTLGKIRRVIDIPSFSAETYRGIIEVYMGDCASTIQVCDSLSKKQIISTYAGSINEQILSYLGQWLKCGCNWDSLPIGLRAQRQSLIGEACYRLGSDYSMSYYQYCVDELTKLIYDPKYKKVVDQYPKATYYLAMAKAKIGDQDPTGVKNVEAYEELKRVLESSKNINSEEGDMMYKDISFELAKVSYRIYEYYLDHVVTPALHDQGGYAIYNEQREEKRIEALSLIKSYKRDNCPDVAKDKECQYIRKLLTSKKLKSIHEK